jgi:hypothetical protein
MIHVECAARLATTVGHETDEGDLSQWTGGLENG